MAVTARGDEAAGVVAHSDHGSQYTSLVYGSYAKQSGIDLSMGSIGDPWDNALAESFVDTFKTELIADRVWQTRDELEFAIARWIGWYNQRRLHSSLGDIPPIEFEAIHTAQTSLAQAA